jgi:hypothetical protein
MELRRLLPDRGGAPPALGAPPACGGVAHMDAEGFDVLTSRKGSAEDVDEPCSPT